MATFFQHHWTDLKQSSYNISFCPGDSLQQLVDLVMLHCSKRQAGNDKPQLFFGASGSTLSDFPPKWELEDSRKFSCKQLVKPREASLVHVKASFFFVSA